MVVGHRQYLRHFITVAGNCWLLLRAAEEEGTAALVIEPRAFALRVGGREDFLGTREGPPLPTKEIHLTGAASHVLGVRVHGIHQGMD